jgi:4-hydroxy-tetrahydrodipicolinate synthase
MFKEFIGCGTALVTPFRKDSSLDEEALRRTIRRQIDGGINFLVPCGTTGESPTLSGAEQKRVVEITVEEARGKVPVMAGAGGNNTAHVVEMAREFEAMGATGILSVNPYYNKPTQEGLYQHFKAIAGAVKVPVILYNIPGRTGVNIEPPTMKRLAEIDNIAGVKEASGNISQMATILDTVPDRFLVLSGDDGITLPLMALGGRGLVSVTSNEIPGEMTSIVRLALANDFAGAREIHRRYFPLMDANFVETNPMPVKAGMALMGLIEPVFRLPMVPPKPETLTKIRGVLESLGLVQGAYAAR